MKTKLISFSEKSLDIWTSTQTKQSWGKIGKAVAETVLEPAPIKNLVEFETFQRKEYQLTEDEFQFCRTTLFSGTFKKLILPSYNANDHRLL